MRDWEWMPALQQLQAGTRRRRRHYLYVLEGEGSQQAARRYLTMGPAPSREAVSPDSPASPLVHAACRPSRARDGLHVIPAENDLQTCPQQHATADFSLRRPGPGVTIANGAPRWPRDSPPAAQPRPLWNHRLRNSRSLARPDARAGPVAVAVADCTCPLRSGCRPHVVTGDVRADEVATSRRSR